LGFKTAIAKYNAQILALKEWSLCRINLFDKIQDFEVYPIEKRLITFEEGILDLPILDFDCGGTLINKNFVNLLNFCFF